MPRHPPYALTSFATLIELSLADVNPSCLEPSFYARCLNYLPLPRFVLSNAPANATWTSNPRFNSTDKKIFLANHAFPPRYLHTVTGDLLSKDATPATTKLS